MGVGRTLPVELGLRILSAADVELNVLAGVPTDHVAVQAENVDFQVWVDAGEKPLLRRVVITYKTAEGEPQYRADFSDWNFDPDVSPALFSFAPPRSEEHTSELQSLMRISYAVFCLKKTKTTTQEQQSQ